MKEPTFDTFLRNISAAGLSAIVMPIRQHSFEVEWTTPISMLFIDGLHDRVSVSQDVQHFEDWVVDGGFIVFHDYSPPFPGVTASVDELQRSGPWRCTDRAGDLIVLRREPN